MGRWARIRVALLPALALVLQGLAAWLFVQTAAAAWATEEPTLSATAASTRTLLLFGAAGPGAMLLLAWGVHTLFSRGRLAPAIATSLLYVPTLIIAGILTWTLLVLLGLI